jgi:hypothetical protein
MAAAPSLSTIAGAATHPTPTPATASHPVWMGRRGVPFMPHTSRLQATTAQGVLQSPSSAPHSASAAAARACCCSAGGRRGAGEGGGQHFRGGGRAVRGARQGDEQPGARCHRPGWRAALLWWAWMLGCLLVARAALNAYGCQGRPPWCWVEPTLKLPRPAAAAMSLVFHSAHPFIPTLRADVRLFEVLLCPLLASPCLLRLLCAATRRV